MPGMFKFNLVKRRDPSSPAQESFTQGGAGCSYWWTFRPACGDLEGFYDQCRDWAPMQWNPFSETQERNALNTKDSGIFIIEDFNLSPKGNRKS